MSRAIADLADLTIANAGTASGAITTGLEDAEWLMIYAPAALTGTVTVQVSDDTATQTWRDLTVVDGTADLTVPAGNAVPVRYTGFKSLRLLSSAAEGAARTFAVTKVYGLG